MSGAGWSCGSLPACTRSDPLAPAGNYSPITVTVNVNAATSGPVVNAASVSGGGSPTATTSDATVIGPEAQPALSITQSHALDFLMEEAGIYYYLVHNDGTGHTLVPVTVFDRVPLGLSLLAMSGDGWACSGNSCSRSDPLDGGATYPPITATVFVPAHSPSPVVNEVSVSGGGSPTATTSDPTLIAATHLPHVAAVSGQVFDLATRAPVGGLSAALVPDPGTSATDPGPIQVGNGTFKVTTLACGIYDLTLGAPGYTPLGPSTARLDQQGCAGPFSSGAMSWGSRVIVALGSSTYNQPPIIDSFRIPQNAMRVTQVLPLAVAAHDPDPVDTLGYQWDVTMGTADASCSFSAPNDPTTNMVCSLNNTPTTWEVDDASITITVTDNQGASTSSGWTETIEVPLPGSCPAC
jgi:hypothetical protein